MSKPQFVLEFQTQGDSQVVFRRSLAAPIGKVFEALTTPAVLQKWLLGPEGWSMPVCEVDLRVGGRYKWGWRNAFGQEMAATGTYLELDPPHRSLHSEVYVFGGVPQIGEQIVEGVLDEEDGVTHLTTTVTYPNKMARDMAVGSGMQHGITASYNRLESLLREEQARSQSQQTTQASPAAESAQVSQAT